MMHPDSTAKGEAMTTVRELKERPVRERVSEAEWQARTDLAACYRLAHYYRMTDQIYTHISARVPDEPEHFLINAYGLLFDEITASSLVKVDHDGTIVDDPSGLGINEAGFVIHSAIHKARSEVNCVMHTHTRAGVAVSAQKHGLLMISQHSMRFHDCLAYHDYEGLALDLDEQQRLTAHLGDRTAMILRNHGLLTCGPTVREAFELMYYLECSCQIQIDALAGNAALELPAPGVAEKVARQFARPERPARERDWPALLRLLDRQGGEFRN
jgi:ribulose-5-phosphate 4-epimerase/fuculose-1-phosphate aldolase